MRVRPFRELADAVRADPESRQYMEEEDRRIQRETTLWELRKAREMTQADLAESLGTTQSAVSRIEHQTDLYLSTLRRYVEALGGTLEVCGVFPDARVPIASF